MLKIYLDWNCITHSKDRFPYILEIAEECASRFIFPYSNAHIRDLLVSRSSNNEYYQQDLDLLTRICGKHFLHFDGKVMQPMFGLPQDFIDECGDLLEIIQKTEFINPTLYQQIKEHTRSYIPKDLYKRIQGAEPKDAIKLINHYIQTIQPDKNLHSIMEESNPFKQLSTIESQFKSVCLGLDVFGFHPEKKNKQITNIDADANHIFYAAHCDYLVSDDKGMIAKAKALYYTYGFATKVVRPEELERIVDEEYEKGVSLSHLVDCIDTYGKPHYEADGAHYRLMTTPIFGLFNACMMLDENFGYKGKVKSAIFCYSFNSTPYLYYTEMERFFDFVRQLLPPSEHERFEKEYVMPITSRDVQTTATAHYLLNVPDLDLVLQFLSDPLAPVPCPMMQIVVSDNCKQAIEELMKKHSNF